MIIFGMNPVREAIRAHPDRIRWIAISNSEKGRLSRLAEEARDADVEVRVMPADRVAKLAEGGVHNGVVAELAEAGYADFDDLIGAEGAPARIFILDGVQDPQNLGAVLRVADAFGFGLVVVPKHESAGLSGAAVKASAGASEWVPVAQVTNLARAIESLQAGGYWIYGADAEGEPLGSFDLSGKIAIVLGNEGRGVRRNVLEHCDRRVAIPMRGRVESLNVATAAAVIGWEVERQRGKP